MAYLRAQVAPKQDHRARLFHKCTGVPHAIWRTRPLTHGLLTSTLQLPLVGSNIMTLRKKTEVDSPFARPLRTLSSEELAQVSGGDDPNVGFADLPPGAKSVSSTDNQGRNHS